MRVDYPVAVDNEYRIWSAFNNHYWPALYLIDAQGRIHHQFDEGDNEEAEHSIQQLLADVGDESAGYELVTLDAHGPKSLPIGTIWVLERIW